MAERKHGNTKRGFAGIFYGVTSVAILSVLALLLVLSYVSVVVNPARLWFISLAGLFFIPLAIVNVIMLLWMLKRRSRNFFIPLLALLPCLVFAGRYVQLDSSEAEGHPVDPTIKVISYNVGRFMLSEDNHLSHPECVDSVFALLKREDADIICLQEFYMDDDHLASVRPYLFRHMPGYKAEYYMFTGKNGSFGNVTLSRIPVTDKGVVKFDQSTNLAIYTDHKMGDRRFRVYNCHFESYNISYTGMVREIAQKRSDALASTGTKMKRSITRRPKQVDKVFMHIENCPVEAFVCGDFNDNPMSYTYYRLRKGRKDSFVESGDGFGATYAFLWPLLRIDYVLVPDRFDTFACRIPRVAYSDHYPVIAEIEL